MNEVLKQRLVGALILVALGVIFWPIVFVQPKQEDLIQQQNIPPQPQVSTAPLESPDPVGLRASPPIAEEAAEPEEPEPVQAEPEPAPEAVAPAPKEAPAREVAATTRRESPEPLALDSDGVPVAWILQVASVSSEDKAESLRERLIAIDKKAYVTRVSAGGKTLYRVYIGPKFEKAKLDAMRAQVDAEFGVTSMVRRYVP